jgi:hypothetical protein
MFDTHLTPDATAGLKPAAEITDKAGYAQRWRFSKRHIDNLLARGLPHLKIGKRRVRIEIPEADAWMRSQFLTQRHGRTARKERPGHEA